MNKIKSLKKLLSVLLSILMLFTMLPMSATAQKILLQPSSDPLGNPKATMLSETGVTISTPDDWDPYITAGVIERVVLMLPSKTMVR